MISIEPLTADMAHRFYGKLPIKTMRGFVAVKNGEPIGIGGIYYEGKHAVAFSEMKPEMKKDKKTIARAIRKLLAMFASAGRPVYAVCDKDEPTAAWLLARLGFVPIGQAGPEGDILIFAGGG